MATELKGITDLNGKVAITRYFGGRTNGMCIQITPVDAYYLSLTKENVVELIAALTECLADTREERA